ncbi:MAG: nucleotidyl transferase AbiEii/AbiGii toxin family protein [Blastocatellia bacterium]
MDSNNPYFYQVQLLIRILPLIAKEKCFALKGGTAINLFVRDLPRLSVDIDLVYMPIDNRETAIKNVKAALNRIAEDIKATLPNSKTLATYNNSDALRLIVEQKGVKIKIELSPVLRSSVFPAVEMEVKAQVEEKFGYAAIPVLALPDLYAGKICAALDRQHPRDLFDIKLLLENEGFGNDLRKTFLVYLISHNRPISELIPPSRVDIKGIFQGEFLQMTQIPVTVEQLEDVRERLIEAIQNGLTNEEKQFLLSFKAKKPDWTLLGLEGIDKLPAVRWKMLNLERMPKDKHEKALQALKEVLSL